MPEDTRLVHDDLNGPEATQEPGLLRDRFETTMRQSGCGEGFMVPALRMLDAAMRPQPSAQPDDSPLSQPAIMPRDPHMINFKGQEAIMPAVRRAIREARHNEHRLMCRQCNAHDSQIEAGHPHGEVSTRCRRGKEIEGSER